MKAKTIVILIVVALLCTSVASAGFFEWVTGNAFSLKNIIQPKAAASKAEVTKTVADNNAAARASPAGKNAATKVSPTEFDSKAVEESSDPAFWVHVENALMQSENWMNQFDKGGVRAATNAPAAGRNLGGVRA